jgi:hypothetical protein
MAQRQYSGSDSHACDPNSADSDPYCFNPDYRCIAKSITCAESMSTPGAKSQCAERASSYLEPLAKYRSFFSGLRGDDSLVLAGIWSPSLLDYQAGKSAEGKLVVASESTSSTATNLLNRGQKTDAACYNPDPALTSDPKGFFGQAQLRLSSFVRKFDPSVYVERSICDVKNYASALDVIAERIKGKDNRLCLSNRPAVVNGTPQCLVGFIDANQPQGLPDAYLPQCSATCCEAWADSAQPFGPDGKDPAIVSACMPEASDCYCATPSSKGLCAQTVIGSVWRKNNVEPPAGKVVNFRCASAN